MHAGHMRLPPSPRLVFPLPLQWKADEVQTSDLPGFTQAGGNLGHNAWTAAVWWHWEVDDAWAAVWFGCLVVAAAAGASERDARRRRSVKENTVAAERRGKCEGGNVCLCIGFTVWQWTTPRVVRRFTCTLCTSSVEHLNCRCWKAKITLLSACVSFFLFVLLYPCMYFFFQLYNINTFYWLASVTHSLCNTGSPDRSNDADGPIAQAVDPIGLSVNADTQGRLERKRDATHGCSTGRTVLAWKKKKVQPDIPRLWPVSKEMSEVVGFGTRPCRFL